VKHLLSVIMCVIFVLLSGSQSPDGSKYQQSTKNYVSHVGVVPDEFKEMIANNLLNNIHYTFLSSEGIYKTEVQDNKFLFQKYNYEFEKISEFSYTPEKYDSSMHIKHISDTTDGGLLIMINHRAHYVYDTKENCLIPSVLIKCDKDGKVMWEYRFENPMVVITDVFKKGDYYYCFGDLEPEAVTSFGNYSQTDICAFKFDANGNLLAQKTFGGSDFDMYLNAITEDEGFRLFTNTQSNDGDFYVAGAGRVYTISFLIDADLNFISFKREDDLYNFEAYHTKGGIRYYDANKDWYIHGRKFDPELGDLNFVIDYDDFYLTASEHITGHDEEAQKALPHISMTLQTTETVYSAYRYDGTLLWRTAVDSTPDYLGMGK